ncbi:MAG: DUF4198 domain-containing protein [Planctomycetaceae bacterium]|jgi:hypothetical protein|nr:DUF4198 domain-containing protein [Planctomycetaceae bacterium]
MKRLIFLLLCLISTGCGQKMPDGMPKLRPVSVTVMQEGKPLADAAVSLRYPDAAAGNWAIGGQTDANGIAQLFTNGYAGAPLGKFKVVLFKEIEEGMEEYNKAMAAAMESGNSSAAKKVKVKIWSCVKPEYNDASKTPLEVEITADTKTLSLDAGQAVSIQQDFVQ